MGKREQRNTGAGRNKIGPRLATFFGIAPGSERTGAISTQPEHPCWVDTECPQVIGDNALNKLLIRNGTTGGSSKPSRYYYVQRHTPNGHRYNQPITTKRTDYDEAVIEAGRLCSAVYDAMVTLDRKKSRGERRADPDMLVWECMDIYYDEKYVNGVNPKDPEKGPYTEAQIKRVVQSSRKFYNHCVENRIRCSDLTNDAYHRLESYLVREHHLKPQTASNYVLSQIVAATEWCEKQRYTVLPPRTYRRLAPVVKSNGAYTLHECRLIYEELQRRIAKNGWDSMYLRFLLGLFTGGRQGRIQNIGWSHWHRERNLISYRGPFDGDNPPPANTARVGNKSRPINILVKACATALEKEHRRQTLQGLLKHDRIILDVDSTPYSSEEVKCQDAWHRLCRDAGVEVIERRAFHGLRHTLKTEVASRGLHRKFHRLFCGHETGETGVDNTYIKGYMRDQKPGWIQASHVFEAMVVAEPHDPLGDTSNTHDFRTAEAELAAKGLPTGGTFVGADDSAATG